MATVIQIKRSSGTTAPSTLKLGEIAYTHGTGTQGNLGDRLFIGEGGVDGNGDANNVTVIGGQYFSDLLDHVPGVATANSALLLDSNKAMSKCSVAKYSSFCFLAMAIAFISVCEAFCESIWFPPLTLGKLFSALSFNCFKSAVLTLSLEKRKGITLSSVSSMP